LASCCISNIHALELLRGQQSRPLAEVPPVKAGSSLQWDHMLRIPRYDIMRAWNTGIGSI
jgi:hypothetical protein